MNGDNEGLLRIAFVALTGYAAFHWQTALLEQFLKGELSTALDIQTVLSKTSVMAIWLLALSRGARCPTVRETIGTNRKPRMRSQAVKPRARACSGPESPFAVRYWASQREGFYSH